MFSEKLALTHTPSVAAIISHEPPGPRSPLSDPQRHLGSTRLTAPGPTPASPLAPDTHTHMEARSLPESWPPDVGSELPALCSQPVTPTSEGGPVTGPVWGKRTLPGTSLPCMRRWIQKWTLPGISLPCTRRWIQDTW